MEMDPLLTARTRSLQRRIEVYGIGRNDAQIIAEAAALNEQRGTLSVENWRRLIDLMSSERLEIALKNATYNKERLENG